VGGGWGATGRRSRRRRKVNWYRRRTTTVKLCKLSIPCASEPPYTGPTLNQTRVSVPGFTRHTPPAAAATPPPQTTTRVPIECQNSYTTNRATPRHPRQLLEPLENASLSPLLSTPPLPSYPDGQPAGWNQWATHWESCCEWHAPVLERRTGS